MADTLNYGPQSDVMTQDPFVYGGFDVSDVNDIPFEFNSSAFEPESCDEFSASPFEFRESSKMLWEDTQLIYQHACAANRFTEDYLKLCRHLEKNIKQVGSLCITKAVLEQKGLIFPELSGMEIDGLIGMVSYHLRKCHAAFRSIYRQSNFLGMSYLNWEFRWVELGNRLKSTDVKIQNILDGKENVEKMLRREETCSGSRQKKETAAAGSVAGLPVNPAAMPINGSLVRALLRQQSEAEKRERRQEKFYDELFQIWGKEGDSASWLLNDYSGMSRNFETGSSSDLSSQSKLNIHQMMHSSLSGLSTCFPNPERGRAADFITADEARKILIEDAENRGDREAVDLISQMDDNRLQYKWMDFIEDPPDDG
ncbi:MAG: hypothetical protein IJI57_12615 [Flexilinea sp.]|nr:hypothetical protein [Flexilinea sp.]